MNDVLDSHIIFYLNNFYLRMFLVCNNFQILSLKIRLDLDMMKEECLRVYMLHIAKEQRLAIIRFDIGHEGFDVAYLRLLLPKSTCAT